MATWEKDGQTQIHCSNCGTISPLDACFLYRAGFGGITAGSVMDVDRLECPCCLQIIDEDAKVTMADHDYVYASIKSAGETLINLARAHHGHGVRRVLLAQDPEQPGKWCVTIDSEHTHEVYPLDIPPPPEHPELARPDGN